MGDVFNVRLKMFGQWEGEFRIRGFFSENDTCRNGPHCLLVLDGYDLCTMKKEQIKYPEIYLIGIEARTNNQNEMEPGKGKIVGCMQRYFQEQMSAQIPDRQKPGTTYCVYADYESDFTGDYTYFIGEEVGFASVAPQGFVTRTIPAQAYAKYTVGPGSMPSIVIKAWQAIWQMSSQDFGAERAYQADFEVYDERASNPAETELDIYVGIKPL